MHTTQHTQVSISLEEGVGISLINSLPEELLFASLKGLRADASLVSLSHKFSLSVQDVQVSVDGSSCRMQAAVIVWTVLV